MRFPNNKVISFGVTAEGELLVGAGAGQVNISQVTIFRLLGAGAAVHSSVTPHQKTDDDPEISGLTIDGTDYAFESAVANANKIVLDTLVESASDLRTDVNANTADIRTNKANIGTNKANILTYKEKVDDLTTRFDGLELGEENDTADEIRDKLESLQGDKRLVAEAIDGLPEPVKHWSGNAPFAIDEIVVHESYLYVSRQSNNHNNEPEPNGNSWWKRLSVVLSEQRASNAAFTATIDDLEEKVQGVEVETELAGEVDKIRHNQEDISNLTRALSNDKEPADWHLANGRNGVPAASVFARTGQNRNSLPNTANFTTPAWNLPANEDVTVYVAVPKNVPLEKFRLVDVTHRSDGQEADVFIPSNRWINVTDQVPNRASVGGTVFDISGLPGKIVAHATDGVGMYFINRYDDPRSGRATAHFYNVSDGTRDNTKDIPLDNSSGGVNPDNQNPSCAAFDGTTLYVGERDTGTIWRYNPTTKAGNHNFQTVTFANLFGIAVSSNRVYTFHHGNVFINSYDKTSGAQQSSEDINTGADYSDINGLFTDGTTMWVSRQSGSDVHAITIADSTRDTAKDVPSSTIRGFNPGSGRFISISKSGSVFYALYEGNRVQGINIDFTVPSTAGEFNFYRAWEFRSSSRGQAQVSYGHNAIDQIVFDGMLSDRLVGGLKRRYKEEFSGNVDVTSSKQFVEVDYDLPDDETIRVQINAEEDESIFEVPNPKIGSAVGGTPVPKATADEGDSAVVANSTTFHVGRRTFYLGYTTAGKLLVSSNNANADPAPLRILSRRLVLNQ